MLEHFQVIFFTFQWVSYYIGRNLGGGDEAPDSQDERQDQSHAGQEGAKYPTFPSEHSWHLNSVIIMELTLLL